MFQRELCLHAEFSDRSVQQTNRDVLVSKGKVVFALHQYQRNPSLRDVVTNWLARYQSMNVVIYRRNLNEIFSLAFIYINYETHRVRDILPEQLLEQDPSKRRCSFHPSIEALVSRRDTLLPEPVNIEIYRHCNNQSGSFIIM